jgi:hypothetical protein
MKTYVVYAERTTLESITIEANSEQEARDKAIEADNSDWVSENDVDWQMTSAKEIS